MIGRVWRYFPGCFADGNGFKAGSFDGGWRDSYHSPTGIYWGSFRPRPQTYYRPTMLQNIRWRRFDG